MKILRHFLHPVKKFSKGMLVLLTLNTLMVICVFIFDSCKKAAYECSASKEANEKFMAALKKNKKAIADVSITSVGNHAGTNTTIATTSTATQTAESSTEPIYLSFPTEVNAETYGMFQNTSSVQELSDLVSYADAVVEYDPTTTNIDYQIEVPIESIVTSLDPLVTESKQYLYAKGFTEQGIQQMIIEEGGTEQDLIPFVMSLTDIEYNQNAVARNYSDFFVNSASARMNPYVKCALVAIGADVLFALGGSSASSWTMTAMKKAFGAVAKRLLGPIGVAIAVVSFGLCIASEY